MSAAEEAQPSMFQFSEADVRSSLMRAVVRQTAFDAVFAAIKGLDDDVAADVVGCALALKLEGPLGGFPWTGEIP